MNCRLSNALAPVVLVFALVGCAKDSDITGFQDSPTVRDRIEIQSETGPLYEGTLRTATASLAIVGATVGLKQNPEDSSYVFETQTDEYGRFKIEGLGPGTYFVDFKSDEYISQTNQVIKIQEAGVTLGRHVSSEPLGTGFWRITVSWTPQEESVRDVDSYLAIPNVATPLGYQQRGRDYNGAKLDRDSTGQLGIETITIAKLRSGHYVYYVNNFSHRKNLAALGNSNVTIQVFHERRHVATIRVPAGQGLTYEAFRIEDGKFLQTGVYSNAFANAD